MICRQSALLTPLSLVLAALFSHGAWGTGDWQPADGELLRFELLDRKQRKVGHLSYQFHRPQPQTLQVNRVEHMDIRRFLIRAVIDQQLQETWRSGLFMQLDAVTSAETTVFDKQLNSQVRRNDAGELEAQRNDENIELPDEAWPMTLWHRGFLQRKHWFGTGGLERIQPRITAQGRERMAEDKAAIECEKYRIDARIEDEETVSTVWFEDNGRLCGLRLNSKLGSILYRRVIPALSHGAQPAVD